MFQPYYSNNFVPWVTTSTDCYKPCTCLSNFNLGCNCASNYEYQKMLTIPKRQGQMTSPSWGSIFADNKCTADLPRNPVLKITENGMPFDQKPTLQRLSLLSQSNPFRSNEQFNTLTKRASNMFSHKSHGQEKGVKRIDEQELNLKYMNTCRPDYTPDSYFTKSPYYTEPFFSGPPFPYETNVPFSVRDRINLDVPTMVYRPYNFNQSTPMESADPDPDAPNPDTVNIPSYVGRGLFWDIPEIDTSTCYYRPTGELICNQRKSLKNIKSPLISIY